MFSAVEDFENELKHFKYLPIDKQEILNRIENQDNRAVFLNELNK